ncbi:diphthine--ammonia ligase [Coccinella septempunctata]|uniref:diphthine--ammonia ligase n=1 Tax=Coccinella septempunctata TaxID=41139 RepID=UPI001D07EED6|nr:diphthine--ammonia ligase [Coccinella septempunctata]XP_044748173.1 diphthine--ammonia ligase [Coccinella septempunctata]
MKVVALISGGKDSTYNMMQCIAAGHEIVALANLFPKNKTEIDSYMYQSVGFEAIDFIAKAMDLPLFQKETLGISKERGKVYNVTQDDEVEDLFELLQKVKKKVSIDAVSIGAILSDYQRVRVENVCERLGLVPLAYLWQRNQEDLLDEMIKCEVDAVLVKVAALGLDPTKHLGRSLSSLQPYLLTLHEKYGINVCGEGGEYETLTLDCPLFKYRIVIDNSEIILHSNDPFAPVGFLKLNKLRLEQKLPVLELHDRLRNLPLKDSDGYVTDQGEDIKELNEDELDSDSVSQCKMTIDTVVQKSSAKQNLSVHQAGNGWLWIGGIRGELDGNPMENAISKLMLCLSQYGHELANVCSVTVYISDMKLFTQINEAYVKYFNFANPPTRACVEVPLNKEHPVILDAISWKILEIAQIDSPVERFTMHVQSRSHWAPANIGPYSQAVKIGEVIYLAGQIGMIPGNLELVEGGVKCQSRLAMRHVERLLKASDSNLNLRNVVQGICYVTNLCTIPQVRKLWEENTNNAIVDYVVVPVLPKSALVEWHVWAHKYNHMFEYEETGRCIENANWSISIFKRWNPEDNIVAIVCHLEKTIPSEESILNRNIFVDVIDYALQKLDFAKENFKAVHNLKIFYPTMKDVDSNEFFDYLDDLRNEISLTYTFVPVMYCKDQNTYLSICGTRTE